MLSLFRVDRCPIGCYSLFSGLVNLKIKKAEFRDSSCLNLGFALGLLDTSFIYLFGYFGKPES